MPEVDLNNLTDEEQENIREFLFVISDIFEDLSKIVQPEVIKNNQSLANDQKSKSMDPKNNESIT